MKRILNQMLASFLSAAMLASSLNIPVAAKTNLEEPVSDEGNGAPVTPYSEEQETANNETDPSDEGNGSSNTSPVESDDQNRSDEPGESDSASGGSDSAQDGSLAESDKNTDLEEEAEAEPLTESENEEPEQEKTGLTRREWIDNLVALFDLKVEESDLGDQYFPDVSASDPDWKNVMTAAEFGLLDTEPGKNVELDKPATRDFAAYSLNQKLHLVTEEETTTYTFVETESVINPDSVQIALDRGWFAVDENNCFNPEDPVQPEELDAIKLDVEKILAVSEPSATTMGNFTFADFVIVFPQDADAELVDDETIIIRNADTLLKPGDVFVIWTLGMPVIREAVEVSGDLSEQTVRCTATDESAAIISAEASGSESIDLETFEPDDGTQSTYVRSRAQAQKLSKDLGIEVKEGAVVAYSNFTLLNGLKVNVTATFNNLKLDWSCYGKDGSISVKGNYTVLVTTSFKANDLDGSKYIPFGSVNVLGIGRISLGIEADLNASADITYTGTFRTGLKKAGSSMGLIGDFQKSGLSADLGGDASMGIAVNFDIDAFLAKANANIRSGLMSQFDSKIYNDGELPNQCTNLYGWLYVQCGASGTILGQSMSKTQDIYNHRNSPVHLSFHWEDGERIFGKCTRGTVFYLTGATSSLGSSSYGGGVSTGNDNEVVYTYTLDADQKATITGYKGKSRIMRIPETIDGYEVVAIGKEAFKNLDHIMAAVLPEKITAIPDGAFQGCSSLQSIALEGEIVSVGSSAFRDCSSLRIFNMPESLTSIGPLAFANCTKLTGIVLPAGLSSLGGWAFRNCDSLTEINIPKEITDFPTAKDGIWGTCYGRVFEECDQLKTVRFDQGITVLPEILNYNSSIEELTIPDTVTKINLEALRNCTGLRKVSLPSSLTAIQEAAFMGCTQLTDINLPAGLTTLGSMAFYNCTSLESINIPKGITDVPGYFNRGLTNTTWHYGECFSNCTNLKNVTFDKGITSLPKILNNSPIAELVIPPTVTEITEGALSSCSNLNKITIPNSVTKIATCAFDGCTSLAEIQLPVRLQTLGGRTFRNCVSLKSVTIPKSLNLIEDCYDWNEQRWLTGENFSGCSSLEEIIFEEGTTRVFPVAAECAYVKKIVIPETVTSIDSKAFMNCSSLEKIDLPSGITAIPDYMAYGCTALTSITLPENVTTIGTGSFFSCTSLSDVHLNNRLQKIGTSGLAKNPALKKIVLPDSLTELGETSLGNTGLTSLELPANLKTIGKQALAYNRYLEEITVPESVEKIYEGAFRESALIKADLKCNINTMGYSLFSGCSNLKEVHLSNRFFTINQQMFENCESLETLYIPTGCRSIGKDAFKNAYSLEHVYIPESVTTIDVTAFSYPDITVIHGNKGSTAETYAADNGFEFICEDIPCKEIVLGSEIICLYPNEKTIIFFNAEPSNLTSKAVFSSGNEEIATVDETGKITAKKSGDTFITIKIGEYETKQPVHVYQKLDKVTLGKTQYELCVNESVPVEILELAPDTASVLDLKFVSENPSIARVDFEGNIHGLKEGTTRITVYKGYQNQTLATLDVTVSGKSQVVEKWDQLESEHPYNSDQTKSWKYESNKDQLYVTFDSRTSLAPGDYLEIYSEDKSDLQKFTGNQLAGKKIEVKSGTFTIKLVPAGGNSAEAWGFKVTGMSQFSDIPADHWGVGVIEETVSKGIFYGTDETHFAPFENMTRSMAVTILWRLAGTPKAKSTGHFKDVLENQWFTEAVNWAAENGIVHGMTPDTFVPGKNINREQLAVMIVNYLKWKGVDTDVSQDLSGFKDNHHISSFALPSMQFAVKKGILSGAENGTMLYPSKETQRVEAAKMFLVASQLK